MIPAIGNTLATVDEETMILMDQYISKLKVHGVSDAKKLSLMRIITYLLRDENVNAIDKLDLNLALIKMKQTLKIF